MGPIGMTIEEFVKDRIEELKEFQTFWELHSKEDAAPTHQFPGAWEYRFDGWKQLTRTNKPKSKND